MRNILAVIGAVVVLFAGLGWYFKWYSFAIQPGSNGKQNIQVELDTIKIADDVKKAGETVSHAVQNAQTKQDVKNASPDFVGPPLPPDMAPRTTNTSPTPGQLALPQPRPKPMY